MKYCVKTDSVRSTSPVCSKMDSNAEKLLVTVEESGPVYDFTMKEHSNQQMIDELWNEEAATLNLVGNKDGCAPDRMNITRGVHVLRSPNLLFI